MEANSFSNTGKLSAGVGQMEGKFFATTMKNAKIWGTNKMKKIKIFCDPMLHLMSLLVIVLCFVKN